MDMLSLPASKNTQLTFKVGIAGTSSTPAKVMVTLEQGTASVSFMASQIGEEWSALIENPGKMFSGEVKFSINVLLNNQLFTPYKSSATISASEEVTVPMDSVKVDSHETVAAVQPAVIQTPQSTITVPQATVAYEAEATPVQPQPIVQIGGLLKTAEKTIHRAVNESVKPKQRIQTQPRKQAPVFTLRKTGTVYK